MSNLGEVMSDRPKPPRPASTPRMLPPPFPSQEPGTHERMKEGPTLDAMLRAYLEEQEREKAEGNTVANVLLMLHSQQSQINEIGAKVQVHEMRLDRHGIAIRALRNRMDTLADGGAAHPPVQGVEHDTGVHQVEELKKHLANKEAELKDHLRERRDSETWWRRKKWDVLLAVCGTLALLGITTLGGIVWYVMTHPSPETPAQHQEKK